MNNLCNTVDKWLTKNKIKRPVILFSDYHETRNNYHLASRLTELGIVLICLLPNSTHILQPLDVSVFRPLKVEWRKVMSDLIRVNKKNIYNKIRQ